MSRHTTFRFALDPNASHEAALRRHAGASRFAYNQSLRLVKDSLEANHRGDDIHVPWTGFDLINAFNAYKRAREAGMDEKGKPGLAWRGEVCAQVFEEGAVDCSKALKAFLDSKRGERRGRRIGFPRFKKRGRCRESFRLRNKVQKKTGRSSIRIGERCPRSVTLPVMGEIRVHDSTRSLRRLLKRGAKVCFATVVRKGGRWYVSLNVEAPDLHIEHRHGSSGDPAIGIDRGIKAFAVAARADGVEVARSTSPKPLKQALRKLRRQGRIHSRRKKGSARRRRQADRLGRIHARVSDIRRHFLHEVSTGLAKTHGRICLEDLNTCGMVRNRPLAREISDCAWAEFARQLEYKLSWRDGEVVYADRFFASSKTCSGCGWVDEELTLGNRTFRCQSCKLEIDRDLNAAINLAVWASNDQAVAGKRSETENARGREGAGCGHMTAAKPARMKREPATALAA